MDMDLKNEKEQILENKGTFNFSGYPSGTHLIVERKTSNWFFWEKVEPKREFRLEEDFNCSFTLNRFKYDLTIRKGFIYDGASIPQFAWSVVGSPFTGLYLEAATIHDALYYASWKHGRKLADEIFLHIMLEMGVSKAKAYTMFKSVRMGGASAFKKRTKVDVSEFLIINRWPEFSQRLTYDQNKNREM
jgi:hypothetical protein